LVANVETSEPHRETAWQVFLPTGPLAFLPLPGNYSAIVWSTPTAKAEYLLALDDDAFLAELQTAFGTALGRMLSVGPRAAYPLRALYATQYVQPRIALTGDAAHTIHPLAGQGVNLGLLDAAALAQVLTEGHAQGKDPGSLRLLRRYERWRKGDNLAMLAAMEGFHRLFGLQLAPVRWIRNWGLNLTHSLTPAKNLLMRQAMGISGGIPGGITDDLPLAARGPVF
jgi:2-octaprenylphenol hydroxylase